MYIMYLSVVLIPIKLFCSQEFEFELEHSGVYIASLAGASILFSEVLCAEFILINSYTSLWGMFSKALFSASIQSCAN